MSWVCLAEVCTAKLIWHITYFSWGNCHRKLFVRAASPVPVGPTKSNDFSWSGNFARKYICLTVPEALTIMSLSWRNQRKRCPKDAVKNVSVLIVCTTTIVLSHGIISSHRKSGTVPNYLKGGRGRDYELGAGAPPTQGGPTFLVPASGAGQSLHHQLFVFVLLEQGLASSLLISIWPRVSLHPNYKPDQNLATLFDLQSGILSCFTRRSQSTTFWLISAK